jgi:hypothetical protein
MRNKDELAPLESRGWTRADAYLGAMARHRTERRKREPRHPRTQTDEPHFLLSTLPFLLLMGALIVIAIGLFAAAWPGAQPSRQPRPEIAQVNLAPTATGSVDIVMRPRALQARKPRSERPRS